MKYLILLISLLCLNSFGQKKLPRSTPEAQTVSSEAIADFADAIEKSGIELHSMMILRHGKVVSEAWWKPYGPDLTHTLYSCSKSFTATAVGFAVAEKKLSVEDAVISFFPDKLPAVVSPNLAKLKIKHLLSMSVGHEKEPSQIMISNDWIRGFLEAEIKHEPGTEFLYNSPATYMLSAIVQKVSGQRIVEYLKPRLFDPLGIVGYDWEIDPAGINVGGWGLRLKTEDMAKFGQLFLQKGKWNGKQILPKAWVEEASTMKIMQGGSAVSQEKRDQSDWLQGYCYQMWRSRNNSYRADGANGQFILVLLEKDAVIAITAETSNMQAELNLVWEHLLPAFDKVSDKAKDLDTKANLARLALKIPSSTVASAIVNTPYVVYSKSALAPKSYTFSSSDNIISLTLETDSISHTIPFGNGQWEYSSTTKRGPYLVERAAANRKGLPAFKTAGAYKWLTDNTLELTLRYIQSPHLEKFVCIFNGDELSVDNFNPFIKDQKTIKAVVQTPRNNAPKLIVRGDDMGYSHSGNMALMKSSLEGIQTSIEVIVPSPWFPEAVKLLAQHPSIDVGLHFAITSEWDNIKWRPLTEAKSLRNADGYFYPMMFPNVSYKGQAVAENPWSLTDYEQELRAQIQMAKKYLPSLSHISGHMGSLMFDDKVKETVRKVGAEFNLPTVDLNSAAEHGIEYVWMDSKNKNLEQKEDGFIAMLRKLENGKTYVFVEHPGLDNEELKAVSHIGNEDVAEARQHVTNIFTSEKVKKEIVKNHIKLVSYKDALQKK